VVHHEKKLFLKKVLSESFHGGETYEREREREREYIDLAE